MVGRGRSLVPKIFGQTETKKLYNLLHARDGDQANTFQKTLLKVLTSPNNITTCSV